MKREKVSSFVILPLFFFPLRIPLQYIWIASKWCLCINCFLIILKSQCMHTLTKIHCKALCPIRMSSKIINHNRTINRKPNSIIWTNGKRYWTNSLHIDLHSRYKTNVSIICWKYRTSTPVIIERWTELGSSDRTAPLQGTIQSVPCGIPNCNNYSISVLSAQVFVSGSVVTTGLGTHPTEIQFVDQQTAITYTGSLSGTSYSITLQNQHTYTVTVHWAGLLFSSGTYNGGSLSVYAPVGYTSMSQASQTHFP